MSTSENAPPPVNDGLQFDLAEYASEAPAIQPTSPTCMACKLPIRDVYYEAGGNIVCATCRDEIEDRLQGGTSIGRALKAFVFGSIAAALGALLYYGFIRLTGINLGLVAVVVGVMVGGAVKFGSGNRGGWFYQLLAVFLTYTAIVAMYAVPSFIEAARNPEPAAPAGPAEGDGPIKPLALKPAAGQLEVDGDQRPAESGAADRPDAVLEPRRNLVTWLSLLASLIGVLYTIPVQKAVASPISGLIFAFALWEAWKINRKTHRGFNGPFRLSAPGVGELPIGSGGQSDVV